MHGSADWRVNPQDSIRLAEKLKENKISHKLIIFKDVGHGLKKVKDKKIKEVKEWFKKYLKN